jgi:hypothetical protein
MPSTLAESALISTEESIMATFDFLAGENVIDEESLSDGETDDIPVDDDVAEDQLLVKKTKIKVSQLSPSVCLKDCGMAWDANYCQLLITELSLCF